jgi:quinol monooxygenase YgiN
MIVITGQIKTDKQTLPDLFARLNALCAPTRAEDGCVFYHMGVEDAEEGIIMAMEGWRDTAALEAHLALPDVVRLLKDFEGRCTTEVSMHSVSETQAISV